MPVENHGAHFYPPELQIPNIWTSHARRARASGLDLHQRAVMEGGTWKNNR